MFWHEKIKVDLKVYPDLKYLSSVKGYGPLAGELEENHHDDDDEKGVEHLDDNDDNDDAYLIFVTDATDGVRVNFFSWCKILQIGNLLCILP